MLPGNFHKNFISVISTFSYIIIEKLAFYLKGSVYPKFYVISQLYAIHSKSLYDQTGMILAILYREKKSFECFLPYMGMAANLNFG